MLPQQRPPQTHVTFRLEEPYKGLYSEVHELLRLEIELKQFQLVAIKIVFAGVIAFIAVNVVAVIFGIFMVLLVTGIITMIIDQLGKL